MIYTICALLYCIDFRVVLTSILPRIRPYNMKDYIDCLISYLEKPEIALALGAMLILYALYFILRCHYKPLLLYKKEGGSVKITKSALTGVVQELCESLGLSQYRVQVYQKGQKLCWKVFFSIGAEDKLPQLVDTLQTRLNQNLEAIFGIEKLGPITIIVNGFRGKSILDRGKI